MSLHGPRGIMATIPVDPDKKALAIQAINHLLSGQTFSRADIFSNADGGRSRSWESRFFGRLVTEGAASVSGKGTCKRLYKMADPIVAQRFMGLLQETDVHVLEKGHGQVFAMTPELKALFDGLLLGDGHLTKPIPGGLSCCYQMDQREDRLSWLEAVRSDLSKADVNSTLALRAAQHRLLPNGKMLNGRPSYLLRTSCYRNLIEQRLRWYPQGKKVVPRDVDIGSPVTLAQWYMGDGGVLRKDLSIGLSTRCFSHEDVEWLCSELRRKHELSSSMFLMNSYPFISMHGRHAARFVEIVRPHMNECFSYKVDFTRKWPICTKCSAVIDNRIGHALYCDDCCSPKAWRERVSSGIGVS